MRITHYFFRVTEASGGVSRAIYDLVDLLASAGHRVTLITGGDSRFPAGWPSRGGDSIEVVRLRPPRGPLQLLDRAALATVKNLLRDTDVLHLHGLWRPSASQVAKAARKLGTPYVLTLHGTLDDWSMAQGRLRKRLYHRLFERRNLNSAASVHCTADAEAEQSRRWFSHDRIVTLPYAVDLGPYRDPPPAHLFRSAHPEVDERPAVLFLSRLHYKKGAEVLVEAMGCLAQNGTDFQLWFAGTGEETYVRHLRSLAGRLVPQARFFGLVTGPEKLALYQCADLLALPTHQENFALVLPEALACGTPVVTTRGTDIWRELAASSGARIVERSAAAFAEAIDDLLTDRAACRRMGAAGRRWVFEWLDPDRITERFEELYRDAARLAAGSDCAPS